MAAGLATFGGALPHTPSKLGLEAWGRTTRRLARIIDFTSLASRKLTYPYQSAFEQGRSPSKVLSGAARRRSVHECRVQITACGPFLLYRKNGGKAIKLKHKSALRMQVRRTSILAVLFYIVVVMCSFPCFDTQQPCLWELSPTTQAEVGQAANPRRLPACGNRTRNWRRQSC